VINYQKTVTDLRERHN
jgi:TPR repeat protein